MTLDDRETLSQMSSRRAGAQSFERAFYPESEYGGARRRQGFLHELDHKSYQLLLEHITDATDFSITFIPLKGLFDSTWLVILFLSTIMKHVVSWINSDPTGSSKHVHVSDKAVSLRTAVENAFMNQKCGKTSTATPSHGDAKKLGIHLERSILGYSLQQWKTYNHIDNRLNIYSLPTAEDKKSDSSKYFDTVANNPFWRVVVEMVVKELPWHFPPAWRTTLCKHDLPEAAEGDSHVIERNNSQNMLQDGDITITPTISPVIESNPISGITVDSSATLGQNIFEESHEELAGDEGPVLTVSCYRTRVLDERLYAASRELLGDTPSFAHLSDKLHETIGLWQREEEALYQVQIPYQAHPTPELLYQSQLDVNAISKPSPAPMFDAYGLGHEAGLVHEGASKRDWGYPAGADRKTEKSSAEESGNRPGMNKPGWTIACGKCSRTRTVGGGGSKLATGNPEDNVSIMKRRQLSRRRLSRSLRIISRGKKVL